MKKILIAIESELIAQTLAESLETSFQVLCCYDGEDALRLIYDIRPDVLVLDLMLPKIDGVNVLRAAIAAGIRPSVVAISDYIPANLILSLEKMNLQALIKTPADSNLLVAKILEIADTECVAKDIEREIFNMLAILGFKINVGGCKIVERALYEYIKDPRQQLSSQLYPAVAQFCGGNASQVEKAIRDRIKTAWAHRNELIWRMYFATGKDGKVRRPTNADFFARVARCIINTLQLEYEYSDDHIKIG